LTNNTGTPSLTVSGSFTQNAGTLNLESVI
jgi:hypothetical protein